MLDRKTYFLNEQHARLKEKELGNIKNIRKHSHFQEQSRRSLFYLKNYFNFRLNGLTNLKI